MIECVDYQIDFLHLHMYTTGEYNAFLKIACV